MTATARRATVAASAGGASAVCVFAVGRGGDAGRLAAARGHAGGGKLRLLPLGDGDGLGAVVQDVPAADFTEETLRRRFADPVDLEDCARAHHAVVTAAAAGGPVVPLPLATLFTDARRAAAALGEQRSRFLAALDLVAGRAEWAVKVSVGRQGPAPTDRVRESASPVAVGPGAGSAYLNRVRGRERDRNARQDAMLRVAQHIHETAATFAVTAVRRRPHGTEITGRDRRQVLNAAYLVEDGRAADLVAAVRALDDRHRDLGLHIEVSGPWVPYSFTGLAEEAGV